MSRTVQVDFSKELGRIDSEMRKHRDAADQIVAKVTVENREFTPDEKKALEEVQTNIVQLRGRHEMLTKHIDSTKDIGESAGESRSAEKTKPAPGRGAAGAGAGEDTEYRAAFNRLVRFGPERMSSEERSALARGQVTFEEGSEEMRDLSSFSGVDGGYLVPPDFMSEVDKAEKDFSGMLAAPTHQFNTSKGNDLPWPTVTDVDNEGELVDENQDQTVTTSASGQPTFGQVTLKAYLASSKLVKVPNQLLQDSAFSIEQLLAQLFAERLGRLKNRLFTTGTGSNQPKGITASTSLGKTAASATAITYGETIDLQHSVDPAYRNRPSSGYMFADIVLGLLRKLLDSDGRPIWMPSAVAGMASGAPGTINGSPYWINQSMAAATTGAKSMLFGDFRTYKIRRVSQPILIRLSERYAEKFQTAFFLFERIDGRSVDASGGAVKHLAQA